MNDAAPPPLKQRLAASLVEMRAYVEARCASGKLGYFHRAMLMQLLQLFETLFSGLIVLLELREQGRFAPGRGEDGRDAAAGAAAGAVEEPVAAAGVVAGQARPSASASPSAAHRRLTEAGASTLATGATTACEAEMGWARGPGAAVVAWACAPALITREHLTQPRWVDSAVDYGGFLRLWFCKPSQGLTHNCV